MVKEVVFDTNGNKYIDFTSGYGVSSLGYSNGNLKNALKEQVDKLLHTSNLYFNEPVLYSGEKIINSSGMAKVYFVILEQKQMKQHSK